MDRRKFFAASAAAAVAASTAASGKPIGCPGDPGYLDPITPAPGRRVSTRDGDPGYDACAWQCRVSLDGVDITGGGGVYTADETLGEVHRFVTRGSRIATENGEPLTEIVRGVVKITGPFRTK